MITNIIITLYEFNWKAERQFLCFTNSGGANKNMLPGGNRKEFGKQKCVSERTLA